MSIIPFLFSLLICSVFAASLTDGMALIQNGKLSEGYGQLEEIFSSETDNAEKGRIAHLLAFAPKESITTTPIYYARFTLKYRQELTSEEVIKLKLKVADSFMEYGEFEKAQNVYREILKASPAHSDYINYQLGYYYLNKGQMSKAFGLWSGPIVTGSVFRIHALKSIGRYWEKLNFPGDIAYLSLQKEFMDGFNISVDEREQEFKLKDLDLFVAKKASPSMLTVLIEKNPIFINNPCGFVSWYSPSYALPNSLIFPFAKKCVDQNKNMIPKTIDIAKAHSKTPEEKSFLVNLFQSSGNDEEACKLAIKESMLPVALTTCKENSKEMKDAIAESLKSGAPELLAFFKGSRAIRSAVGLASQDRMAFMKVVGEEVFVQEFLDNEAAFFDLMKDLNFSDESLLKFVLFNHRTADKAKLIAPLIKSNESRQLLVYITDSSPYAGDLCVLSGKTLKKIALESKIIFQTLSPQEIECSEGLIEEDKGLFLLALDPVIKNSEKIEIDKTSVLTDELKNLNRVKRVPEIARITALSPEKALDLNSYLSIQNHPVRSFSSSEALLSEMKKLRNLRNLLSRRTWTSKSIAEKANATFNGKLDEVLSKNHGLLVKLKLQDQIQSFMNEMRII